MKNDFGGLLVTGGDVTYVPHQNWRSDTLSIFLFSFKSCPLTKMLGNWVGDTI